MSNIHSERLFIDWVIEVLEDGGLTVGDSVAPSSVPAGEGYVVVYSIGGGETAGTIDNPREDAAPNVQVTSSSEKPSQARWLVDRVRTLLNAAVPATLDGGRQVVWLDFPIASVSVIRDDKIQPPRYMAPDRFELGTTPT